MKRIGSVLAIAVLALIAFTVYRNVLSDDSAVRAMAKQLAHDTCGDCKAVRIEGRRGVLSESFEFTMQNGTGVSVACRRANIAFGDYSCTATKH